MPPKGTKNLPPGQYAIPTARAYPRVDEAGAMGRVSEDG